MCKYLASFSPKVTKNPISPEYATRTDGYVKTANVLPKASAI